MWSDCVPQSASLIYENPSWCEIWKETTLPHPQIPTRLYIDMSPLPVFLQDLLSQWHRPAPGSYIVFCALVISHDHMPHKERAHSIWILSLVNKLHFSFCIGHWSILVLHMSEGTTIPPVHWVFSFGSVTDGWQVDEWLLHPAAPGSLLLGENDSIDLHRRESGTRISRLMIPTLFENINVKHYHYG